MLINLLSMLLFSFPQSLSLTPEQEGLARKEYPTETLYQIWLAQLKDQNAAEKYFDALSEKHTITYDKSDDQTVTVTYFAKGSDDTDYILQSGGPDFYGLRFKQIGNSHIYFCIQKIPSDAWFPYGINEFKRKAVQGIPGLYQNSMEHIYDGAVIGPNAPLSASIQVQEGTPKGSLAEFVLNSKFMNEKRKIQVYKPANYDPNHLHNLLLQFDGQNFSADAEQGPTWRGWTPLPTILDNLIHQKKIGPTVAIFIHNQGNRSRDLIGDQIADFVALELLPWAKEHYSLASDPQKTVVSGPSRAGFAAVNSAMRHANSIGSVLSQSGSFYYTLQEKENWPIYPEFEGQLIRNIKKSEKKNIQFYLDVGLYDLGLAAVGTNRQLKEILEMKGYSFSYHEYKGGHSHLGWRHSISQGLIELIGQK